MADFEVNFPVTAKLTRVIDDQWTVELYRRSDETDHFVAAFREIEPTELFTKFGVKVEKTITKSEEDGKADAEQVLSAALTGLGSRTIIPTSEVQDLLLDLRNELGL